MGCVQLDYELLVDGNYVCFFNFPMEQGNCTSYFIAVVPGKTWVKQI